MTRSWPLLVLSLAACGANRVEVEGIDPLEGPTASALQVVDGSGWSQLLLTNVEDACEKQRALGDVGAALGEAYSQAEFCGEVEGPWMAQVDAMAALYPVDAWELTLDAAEDAFVEGEQTLTGRLSTAIGNDREALRAMWDPSRTIADGCLDPERFAELERTSESWALQEVAADLSLADGGVKGHVEGRVVKQAFDDDFELVATDVGTFSVRVDAVRCEL